jgi:PAS domain S-box-containing protein
VATTIEPQGDGTAEPSASLSTFTYGVDPDGVITWASEGITRVLGWTLDEIVGAPAAGLVHPDDLARGMSERHALYENRSTATASIRALRKAGDYAWLALESHPDLDASGAVVGSTVSARALLHVDEMTPVLAEAESRYRMLALNTFDVVAHQVDDVLEWISPSVVSLLGHSADELVGRSTVHLWHPDDLPAVAALRERARAGARGEGLFRLRHKDGHHVWLDVAAAPDGSASRLGLVVSLRDASARVQAEEDLRAREAEYRLLAENAVDLVVRTDLDGRVAWVSPSSRRLLGYRPEELVGRSLAELMHPDDVAMREQVRAEVRAGYSAEYLARYRDRDGHYVWLEVSGGPAIDDSGAVVGIVGSARDATAEVAAREAQSPRRSRRTSSPGCARATTTSSRA